MELERVIDLEKVRVTAENYYRDGDFYCSEAIVKVIRDEFKVDISDEVISMASGFPVGMGGSGCTCGAVAGGIMALGLFFGRSEARDEKVGKAMELSKELHDFFKGKNKSVCCRVLTKGMTLGEKEHMDQCVFFTGQVAEETAKIICRELNIDTK
ncbi:hypothetical protein CHL78_006100 [Romboutsia weinsteinii]|uniref:C_GCAxxG_C_C family protein n=2 Tax=Romboutsia weinsteinii TaxID=2020949 RepID=A0A371J671_9FIRM|nr:hypothetical protein CHL78_006100 [Romboutsia weinsteinii]